MEARIYNKQVSLLKSQKKTRSALERPLLKDSSVLQFLAKRTQSETASHP